MGHVYTHCVHLKREFYYSAYKKACVLAATDNVHVCNCGSKGFSSIKGCLASCVNGRHVSDRCYGSTLFFPSTRWEECRRRCVLRTQSEYDETPAAETGSPRQLRHPYVAEIQAHGGARCVSVTRHSLKSHRCLIGSNQFDSLDGCGR
ncbi:hypothetical protein MRX96_028253 [Rhipicephalus microplus]